MYLALYIQDCFSNIWKYYDGVYWAVSMVDYNNSEALIHMSRTGISSCPGGAHETHKVKYPGYGAASLFDNRRLAVEVSRTERQAVVIKITKTSELEPDMTKPQIISNHSDKLGYAVGDIIKSECVVKNIGGAGTVYLTVGLGYIDSSDMIYLTGVPSTDQLFLNYQQLYTFKEDVKVDITDYYRQRGIGWAYLQQQMYFFFLVGHKENGDLIWDTERHIKIYIDKPEGFKDPTDIDESIIGDTLDDISGIIPDVGDVVPDTGDVIDWVIDKITPEPKEEDFDVMPFIYIGFMGLIGYMLIRSQ